MRDEEYGADQVGAYGAREQPAVAARMTPHLRLSQAGTVCAALGVAASVAAVVSFPRFTTAATGQGWAVLALVCSVAMLAICVLQLVAWRQAMAWWGGRRDGGPAGLARASWWAHVASYLVALATLWACISGSALAGWAATAAPLLAATLLLVLAAQVLGAVQYVRPEGPPGTLPTHMRRLLARERARQAAAAAIVERDSPHDPPHA